MLAISLVDDGCRRVPPIPVTMNGRNMVSMLGPGPVIGCSRCHVVHHGDATSALLLLLASVPVTSGDGVAPVRNPADVTFWVMKPPPW